MTKDTRDILRLAAKDLDVVASNLTEPNGINPEECAEICAEIAAQLRDVCRDKDA